MPDVRFKLDWCAGASAQVEVFSPIKDGLETYQLKYIPPFRSTIRPPVEDSRISPEELDSINKGLDELITTVDARASGGPGLAPDPQGNAVVKRIEMLGQQLLDLIVSPYIQSDIVTGELFLEIGMDEALLNYPWELMHDGTDFLCLKHAMGRFVNGSSFVPPQQRTVSQLGTLLNSLSILLISVPNPQPRGENNEEQYPALLWADDEMTEICEILEGIDGINLEILSGNKATYDAVYDALKRGPYQIIHFIGHAKFSEKRYASALVLNDHNMPTGAVTRFFSKSPPVLCFVNACETARFNVSKGWKDRYDVFGLARAFLETGAYLLGSRWEINDKAAVRFAKKFYSSLLQSGEPLGKAVLEGRKACKEDSSLDNFAWASYILYGDPRVCFRRAP
jgi:CHAT domain-containing protein